MAFPHIEQEEITGAILRFVHSLCKKYISKSSRLSWSTEKKNQTKPTVKTCLKNHLQILINMVNATGFWKDLQAKGKRNV